MHDLARAQLAAQPILRRGGVEDEQVTAADRGRQRLECLGGRVDDEETEVAALERAQHRRRDLLGRFHANALQRKVGLKDAAEDLRLVDADLRARERMLAELEHDTLVGADRLVTRIALDVDEADGDARLRLGR